MCQLETKLGHTIGLGTLRPDSGDGVVLASVNGTAGVSFHIPESHTLLLHTTAPGKAMLAYLPPDERENYYDRMTFQRFTENTITSRSDFEAELTAVLEKGYSIDVSEKIPGAHCVGVPIFDSERKVVAALWTTGPATLLPVRNFDRIAALLKTGAEEITGRIYATRRATNRDYITGVVEQARQTMLTDLSRPVEVQQMARDLFVSYSWFRQVFKEETGSAPAAYHLKLRIQKAAELLRTTDLSIRQISEELGFKTQNHFSALFKRKTGQSPMNYQTANKP